MSSKQNKLKQEVPADRGREIFDGNYQFYTAHLETAERSPVLLGLLSKQLAELSAHEGHIWDSSEYTQVTAAAAWIAGARAAIVGDLLNCAYQSDPEAPLGCDLSRPVPDDLAAAIAAHTQISDTWVNYRDEVSIDPDFRLGDGYTIRSSYEWPTPNKVSPELFEAMQYMTGVRNMVDTSTVLDRKLSSTAVTPDHMNPYFKDFMKSINMQHDELLKRRQILRVRNRDGLDLKSPAGRALYGDMVRLLEDSIALGIHRLYPASLDPTMRLNARHGKKPEPSEIILPLLDPNTMVAPPTLPAFSAEDLTPPELPEVQIVATPVLPRFSMDLLMKEVPVEPVAPLLPELDADYFGAPTESDKPSNTSLPTLDASDYFNN